MAEKFKAYMKKENNRNGIYAALLSFFLPVVILLIVFMASGFYPFGNRTLFIMDMKDEYLGYFASLRYIFTGKSSLFFNWSKSMGGNYIGLFAFYIASPLSFITVFFPLDKMDIAILVLTLLKTGLAGLSFYFLAAYIFKNDISGWTGNARRLSDREKRISGKKVYKKAESKSGPQRISSQGTSFQSTMSLQAMGIFITVPFAVSYALISYNILYGMCLMWLDGVIMLPMIILGLEKIFDGKKGLLYIISLALLFISNYYTGYMAGIFTALFFIFREVTRLEKGKNKRILADIWKFFYGTVLSACIAAPVVIPTYLDLRMGKLSDQTFKPDIKNNYEFSKVFSKFKNGVYDSITNTGLPGIYAGYLVTALGIVFIIFYAENIRERAGALALSFIILYSFCNTKIDEVWHGFQYPNWFPYRYAFVFSFFLVYMALRAAVRGYYSALNRRSAGSGEQKKTSLSGEIKKTRLITLLCVSAMTIFVSADMALNARALIGGLDGEFSYVDRADFKKFLAKDGPLVKKVNRDRGLFRVNQQYEFSKNDALFYGYNGMTHYSSTYNTAVNNLTMSLGLAHTYIWNSGYGSDMLLDSLFGVKYVMDDSPEPSQYKTLKSTDTSTLYKNTEALSFCFSAPVSTDSPDLSGNPYANQNSFLNSIAGTQNEYFKTLEASVSADENLPGTTDISFTAESSDPVYLYTGRDMSGYGEVYVNDRLVGGIGTSETACSLFLGEFEKGEQVSVRISKSFQDTSQFAVAEMDSKLVNDELDTLRKGNMKITSHHGGVLKGKVNIKSGEKLITSIPYDSGWTMRVDGKKTKFTKYANTFIMADIGEGEHRVELSYVSPGFVPGVIIALGALFIIILEGAGYKAGGSEEYFYLIKALFKNK